MLILLFLLNQVTSTLTKSIKGFVRWRHEQIYSSLSFVCTAALHVYISWYSFVEVRLPPGFMLHSFSIQFLCQSPAWGLQSMNRLPRRVWGWSWVTYRRKLIPNYLGMVVPHWEIWLCSHWVILMIVAFSYVYSTFKNEGLHNALAYKASIITKQTENSWNNN